MLPLPEKQQRSSLYMAAANLEGKTALVTGSSGGIGRAIALALIQQGCQVVLHGIESQPVWDHPQEREWLASARYEQADFTDVAAIERVVRATADRYGAVDILVNNAVTRHFGPIESFPVAAWDRALAVNVSAAFHTVRMALPSMRERGWGRIINMTSVYGQRGTRDRIDYITSKAALMGMTRAVAAEVLGSGITCNAVCPGSVLTPNIEARLADLMASRNLDREAATREFLQGKQPGLRFIPASHVAELVLFLCGEAAGDITGSVLPMEGGWLAT